MINKQIDIRRNLVIVGGGGHSHSVIDSANGLGIYSEVVIVDPKQDVENRLIGCRVIDNDDELPRLFEDGFEFAFIGVGSIRDTSTRRKINEILSNTGFSIPTIIDASAIIALNCGIEPGVYVGKRATINSGASVGRNAIINTGAIIEHDCHIGEYAHIAVGAVICGECLIEEDVFVGANSTVIQGVRIGAGSIIGAGSTILADVPNNMRVVGLWKG